MVETDVRHGDTKMSYRITVVVQPEGKYPFLLATEADGIPMTHEEMVSLQNEIWAALREYDEAKKEAA